MYIEQLLLRLGVATWVQDIVTQVPTTAANTFQIGKNLPTDVGFIYGLSTYADGVDPDNNALISTTNAENLYITLKQGATEFLSQVRMSDLLNEFAGSPIVRPQKYTPVNIPAFDLSKSFYANPTSIVAGFIRLKLWYIQSDDWARVRKELKIPDSSIKKK